MKNFANVSIYGFIISLPEIVKTPNQRIVSNFNVGVKYIYKTSESSLYQTHYFQIEVWENLAKQCVQHLKKGKFIKIEGQLKQDRWKSRNSYREKIKITAYKIYFQDYIFENK